MTRFLGNFTMAFCFVFMALTGMFSISVWQGVEMTRSRYRLDSGDFPSSLAAQAFEDFRLPYRFQDTDGLFGGAVGDHLCYKHAVVEEGAVARTVLAFLHISTGRVWVVGGIAGSGMTVIPLKTDGDARDLYRSMTGYTRPELMGDTSREYERFRSRTEENRK